VLHTGTGADIPHLRAAHNTTLEFVCIVRNGGRIPPLWFKNELLVPSDDGYSFRPDGDTGGLIGILIINGNRTCGTFHIYCSPDAEQIMHNTLLTVEG